MSADARAAASRGPSASRRRHRRRKATATEHSELGEKLIAGVPARIMRPRLVFASCLAAIIAFGLLMVYSASSVEALKETGSSTYYLVRQAVFVFGSLVLLVILNCRRLLPWRLTRSGTLWAAWFAVILMLVVVRLVGVGGDTWGASRWINLGFFTLQPSELAKPVIMLVVAKIFADYYEDRSIDTGTFILRSLVAVGLPLALIMSQPDLGTTLIILGAVFIVAFIAGVSYRLVAIVAVCAALAVLALIVVEPYRFARLLVASDPWSDPYDTGYQATLGIMAFASGGLFGRGLGGATMKYSYLPEAHNDYILAIIGEELGFFGTILFVAVFCAMIWAAFSIARRAPTLHGQLLASGCAALLMLQFLVNALGILGVTPMTGKPLPFVSYGGSAVLGSITLAAIILRVSLESGASSVHAERRADFALMDDQDAVSDHIGRSTAGEPRPRSASRGAASGFSVYDGGARQGSARTRPAPASRRERSTPAGGYERINLSGGEPDRLRRRDDRPRETGDGYGSSAARPRVRRSGDGREPYRPSSRRDRYDR